MAKMEELRSAIEQQVGQMLDLFQKNSAELRTGFRPAIDNFIGFFHAIDWKEPWLMGLLGFHFVLFLIAIISRKNTNFQMCFFLLALGGVYFAPGLNRFLGENWKSFAGQNYFNTNGLFLSTLWSGPLLIIAIIIMINTLFSLCQLMVRWKRAELRHKARLAQSKED